MADGGTLLQHLVARALYGLRPPQRLALSEWADKHFYLSKESAANPGKWKTIPYQRGIMDSFTDPEIEESWVKKSARVGWTKIMNAVAGYHCHHDPCPVLIVQPTEPDAEEYSKEEIAPMLRDVPVLLTLLHMRSRDTSNTILHKTLSNGAVLHMVGANAPTGFRRVSRRVILLDEVNGYPASAGAEGDPVKLAINRSEYYHDRKIGGGSTPTMGGRSRITLLYESGDQRKFYLPCPHCGVFDFLAFRRESTNEDKAAGHFMHWPKDRPEAAHFVCRACASSIEHSALRPMSEDGRWTAHAERRYNERGRYVASFHIWAAYSYSPNASWGRIATEYVAAARQGIEKLKTVVNTVIGEDWQDKGDAPEWERLYQLRDKRAPGPVPRGGLFLTAGVDVQKDRLVWEVVAWGRGKRSWSVDAGVEPGDTSDIGPTGPWSKLQALLERSYTHEGGVPMIVSMLAVDSGYNTQNVYSWCRQFPMNRVIAVKGDDNTTVLISAPSTVDIQLNGRKISRGYKMWPVSSKMAKAELYGWLKLQPPTAESGDPDPPGFCRFPEYGEEFFKQLTGEQLVQTKNRKGFVVMEWEIIPGRENHYLDARIYARCGAALVGLDRFTDGDWSKLERALSIEPPAAAVQPAPQPVPQQQAATSANPGTGQRSPWIGRREGWLNRGR